MKSAAKPYFPALDGLRFFAFLFIFFQHITFYLPSDRSENLILSFLHSNGWIGVSFFFALSGFLTTLLLLQKQDNNGRINVKRFLTGRALRIWPLYFTGLIAGYGLFYLLWNYFRVLPSDFFPSLKFHLPWFLLFLGNWGIVIRGWEYSRAVSELWIICIYQQLYLIWPFIVGQMKNFRHSLFISLGLIIFSLASRAIFLKLGAVHPQIYANTFNWLDTFTLGSLVAQVLFFKPAILDKIRGPFSSFWQLTVLALLVIYLYSQTAHDNLGSRQNIWSYPLIGLSATFFLIGGVKPSSLVFKFIRNNLFVSLGKIGYGLYIWHVLALETVFYFAGGKNNYLLVILGLPLTILLAFLSSRLLEKPFLLLKNRKEN